MEVLVKFPRTIEVQDYHEFAEMERVLRHLNGKIRVTELGFEGSAYIGLIHMNTAAHKKLIKELSARLGLVE
jgi:hypothetical protein